MIAPLTTTGARRLRDELEHLKSVKRPAVIHAIAEARAHGDLKENAEYHAAREQQGFIEGRIQQLEFALSHAQLIDVATLNAGTRVVFGATIELAESETGEEEIEACENCGKPMALKRGRFGQFLACTGYPDCKGVREMGEATKAKESSESNHSN